MLYQHVEIFPEVLGHEAKEGEESPSKAVKAGVTIVGVPSGFHTCKALWTSSKRNTQEYCNLTNHLSINTVGIADTGITGILRYNSTMKMSLKVIVCLYMHACLHAHC